MSENKITRPIEYKSLSKGRWYEWGTINENESYFTGPPSDPKAIHCQFTGLTDCTGVKIFEGDKIKQGHKKYIVKFHDAAFWCVFHDGRSQMELYIILADGDAKVIGNIHEQAVTDGPAKS